MIDFVNQRIKRSCGNAGAILFLVLWIVPFDSGLRAQVLESHPTVKGMPRVIHYTRKDFQSDPQIWSMCQDKSGILYFGSNNGTLIFNGETWQQVKFPNNSSVRSLCVSADGRVFAGGFNEFGVIRKDAFGKYFYESWVHYLRMEDRNIENIWSIHEVQGHMVFRSYKLLIAITGSTAVTLPTAGSYEYSTVLNETLYVTDTDGVKAVNLKTLEQTPVIHPTEYRNEYFMALVPGESPGEMLVVTRQGSFFGKSSDNRLSFISRVLPGDAANQLTTALRASDGKLYLGTLSARVMVVTDPALGGAGAEILPDLQDNTVHNLFETREGNIWALLNNGIDCIDINSPVTQLFDKASIFDVAMDDNIMYLATNQGVYRAKCEMNRTILKDDFISIAGLEGQAWSLQRLAGQLVCGHDQGVVIVNKDGFTKLPGVRGVWKVVGIRERPDHFLVCTYDGIWVMKLKNARFEILHRLQGFNESSRDILQSSEPGVFWVCHGYKGVFRIKIDPSLERVVGFEHFRDQNGLTSYFNVNVWNWHDTVLFTTNHGIFSFNEKVGRFEPYQALNAIFGTDKNVRQLLPAGERTWFIHHDEAGYFENGKDATVTKGLFLQLKGTFNESMECIVPFNNENVLMGTREGLFSFDLSYEASRAQANTSITQVRYTENNAEQLCALTPGSLPALPHRTSDIRFDFAVPDFDDKMNTQYSYRVLGVDPRWSEWQDTPYKEFSLLPPGRYTFEVKARSHFGEMALADSYTFAISPVWYKTTWAYGVYFILSALALMATVRLVHRRIDFVRKKTRREEEEKRRLLQLELDRMKLAQEKEAIIRDKVQLEEDVIFKSKELANYTMLLVKKRELLTEMYEQLNSLKEALRNDQARQGVRDLMRKITTNLQNEEHIKVFEANFERVHHEFFAQLRANYPDLTNKELQLCAFVKMNLTNKEIASILNLSVRGIETARYRLRKRLGINQDEDMADFLEKLYSPQDAAPEIRI